MACAPKGGAGTRVPQICNLLRETLSLSGFDIVVPFSVKHYNAAVRELKHTEWCLPIPSPEVETPGGILVGNTKAVWEPFCNFMNANKENPDFAQNPFDRYTEACIFKGIESVNKAVGRNNWSRNTRFSHSTGKNFVHIQLACKLSEFAYLNPICHLNVHEDLGPWFALRAVIVTDLDLHAHPHDSTSKPSLPNPYPDSDEVLAAKVKQLFAPGKQNTWCDWLDLRDLATSDKAKKHRYSENQIRYHYTYDRKRITIDEDD
eukprot:m.182165 g.182165  ORF g.182165 m.182165 type:complete len:261 (-) comp18457_c0_seq1:551-1333(-)